ncbi:protein kinase, partial [Gemmatimonas aurantiaca]|nr:protein kinase [Gemmatimonas aurantiaca]
MELVEGQTLSDLSKSNKLDVNRIVEIAIQLCDGLGAAHEKHVVHRDIKPSNIVIDSYGRPKILDFGLAAIQGGENLTKTGSTLGTIRYMSPEQVQGQEIDRRSDLFSLGVLLYELLAGRTPFEQDNEAATLKSIITDNPEPLARYKADVPDELQRTVSKLLEKQTSLRYQHAEGVTSDLKRLIAHSGSTIVATPAKPKSKAALVISSIVILSALAFGAIKFWPSSASVTNESTALKKIAVLPFENLGSAEDEYFADGITDEITSRLANLSGLGVISRTSSMRYKKTDKTLQQIGAELGVSYILEGTILWDKSGDTDWVRIIPQLIQVADDRHLWSESYQRALTQIFSLQSEIATSIARELDVTLLQTERESLRKAPTANVEAYKLYLRGRSLFYTYSRSENEQAIEIFKTVIGMDSVFSLAYAGLSLCYNQYSNSHWDYDERWLRLAEESARHAIALDGGSAEAHFALGFIFERYMNLENMEREMQKALEINPNHAHAHDGLGDIHSIRGELDDAIWEYSAALTIDPFLLPSFWCKADVHLKQGQFRDAEITIQKALLIDPENRMSLFVLGNTFRMLGMFGQSLVILNKTAELRPDFSSDHLILGLAHLERGLFEAARDEANVIYGLTGSKSFNFEWTYLLGRISLQQGDYVEAKKQFELVLAVETLSEIQFSHAHFALGECFLQMSNYREAIGEFNKVGGLPIGRFQHNYPWARRCYKLGICYEALGEKDSAIAQYETFLDIWRNADSNIPSIEDAKARLAKLQS